MRRAPYRHIIAGGRGISGMARGMTPSLSSAAHGETRILAFSAWRTRSRVAFLLAPRCACADARRASLFI